MNIASSSKNNGLLGRFKSTPSELVPVQPSIVPDTYWRSLHYFNLYRLTIGGVFIAIFLLFGQPAPFGADNPLLFLAFNIVYVIFSVLFILTISTRRPRFSLQLSFQIMVDIVCIIALMSTSGGISSGLGLLLVVSIASSGLIGRGRLVLFYASLATIAILLEHGYRAFWVDDSSRESLHAALLSLGFFATAWLAHMLARHAVASEQLAAERGIDLANLAQVNELVIQDMQDGVIVVDKDGCIRSRNAQADHLLGRPPVMRQEALPLEAYFPVLAERLKRWIDDPSISSAPLRIPSSNGQVRARFIPVGTEQAHGTVIFIEDLSQLQSQAQQIKLAALGRLTANIAHEIRNPLSAISHATELLQEEPNPSETESKLLRIIRDNVKRLDRLVQEVLQLNRRDRAQLEEIHPTQFFSSFIDEFCQSEQIPVTVFSLEIDSDRSLCFDRMHLHQVIWNLCRNAWRHCRQLDGSIRLCVSSAYIESMMQLDVIDDGPGVDPAIQPQLFEPFFTTESRGTGLGLYIAREVCEANSATLDYVEVAPGGHFRLCCKGGPC
jgi:two-component system sensor histidine kinase PilS (NtrC family)